jgi:hypothetical protein
VEISLQKAKHVFVQNIFAINENNIMFGIIISTMHIASTLIYFYC